jgi:thiol-disulfide isomerase/thioredoxin
VVVLRFGHDWDETCMQMDEVLSSVADKLKNFAVIYLVDITEVPDFNAMYELYDPCTVMFFFRNKVGISGVFTLLIASLRLLSRDGTSGSRRAA